MRKLALLTAALMLMATVGVAASKATGKLKVVQAGTVIELVFANKQKLNISSKGTTVPEGTYTPENYAILKKGRDGSVWRLEGIKGSLGEMASITVTKGETKEIDVGPPLKIAPMRFMSGHNKAGDLIIPIAYTIVGKNGESYSLELKMGARNAPLPFFQILDGNDKVLQEGQFEYG